jgi:hypothetical protein
MIKSNDQFMVPKIILYLNGTAMVGNWATIVL